VSNLSEDQLILVDLIMEYNGDVEAACEAAVPILDRTITSLLRSTQSKSIKEEIQARSRDKLTYATVAAVNTTIDMMTADNTTEQGALRLKAAAEVLDRTGTTKHTSVEVTMEQQPGIILLNPKAAAPNPDDYVDIDLENPDT